MAAAFVTATNTGTNFVQDGANYTLTIDCTGCSLVVLLAGDLLSTTTTITATLGGSAMTSFGVAAGGDSARARILYFISPTTGSQNIVVTGSDASIRSGSRAVGYSGTDLTTPLTNLQSGSSAGSTAPTLSTLITPATGNLAFGGFCNRQTNSTTPTIVDIHTARGEVSSFNNTAGIRTHASEGAAGVAFGNGWSWITTNFGWSAVGCEVNAAAAGGTIGGPILSGRTLQSLALGRVLG